MVDFGFVGPVHGMMIAVMLILHDFSVSIVVVDAAVFNSFGLFVIAWVHDFSLSIIVVVVAAVYRCFLACLLLGLPTSSSP